MDDAWTMIERCMRRQAGLTPPIKAGEFAPAQTWLTSFELILNHWRVEVNNQPMVLMSLKRSHVE